MDHHQPEGPLEARMIDTSVVHVQQHRPCIAHNNHQDMPAD
jgi:hypothetical protein